MPQQRNTRKRNASHYPNAYQAICNRVHISIGKVWAKPEAQQNAHAYATQWQVKIWKEGRKIYSSLAASKADRME